MVPSKLRATIVLERLRWIHRMIADIHTLPLDSLDSFINDPHTPAAAESYLRRGLEALFDLGRHLLSKGFGKAPVEYKAIATDLQRVGVLDQTEANLMVQMAGFRNRLVHFYDEVRAEELYEICSVHVSDVERLASTMERWILQHPDRVDQAL